MVYFIVALCVGLYCMKIRRMPLGASIIFAVLWPLAFLLYVISTVTGRPIHSYFGNMSRRSSGQDSGCGCGTGKGKGRGRHQ